MRNVTPVVLNLLIVNGIVYLVEFLVLQNLGEEVFYQYFTLWKINPEIGIRGAENFQAVQLVLHFFSHSPGSFMHILFNMIALFSIGQGVERVMGSKRFLQFYLFSGLFGGLLTALFDPSPVPVLGASGAVAGVAIAFAMIFPNQKLILFPIFIPIKAWKLVGGFFLLTAGFVAYSFAYPKESLGGISHFGHLAGMIAAITYFYAMRLVNQMKN